MLGGLRSALGGYAAPYFGAFPLVLGVLGLLSWRLWKRQPLPAYLPLFLILWLGLLSFAFVHGAVRLYPRPWYFLMAPLITAFAGAALVGQANPRVLRDRLRWVAVVLVAVVWFALQRDVVLASRYLWQEDFYLSARWLTEQPNRRIGSFNSEIMGFYAPGQVVNLDGLVNDSVLPALSQRRLYAYAVDQRLEAVVDFELTVEHEYRLFWGVSPLGEYVIPDRTISNSVWADPDGAPTRQRVYRLRPS
jgi:hypothetical protein